MPGSTAGAEIVHATLVARGQTGVLLRGSSGAGKSDLALRLIEPPGAWRLVSDDRVALWCQGDSVFGRAPSSISGKLEVRGLGIVEVAIVPQSIITLVIDLVPRAEVPRMADEHPSTPLLGVMLPCYRLHGLDASAVLKVSLLLDRELATKSPTAQAP